MGGSLHPRRKSGNIPIIPPTLLHLFLVIIWSSVRIPRAVPRLRPSTRAEEKALIPFAHIPRTLFHFPPPEKQSQSQKNCRGGMKATRSSLLMNDIAIRPHPTILHPRFYTRPPPLTQRCLLSLLLSLHPHLVRFWSFTGVGRTSLNGDLACLCPWYVCLHRVLYGQHP